MAEGDTPGGKRMANGIPWQVWTGIIGALMLGVGNSAYEGISGGGHNDDSGLELRVAALERQVGEGILGEAKTLIAELRSDVNHIERRLDRVDGELRDYRMWRRSQARRSRIGAPGGEGCAPADELVLAGGYCGCCDIGKGRQCCGYVCTVPGVPDDCACR